MIVLICARWHKITYVPDWVVGAALVECNLLNKYGIALFAHAQIARIDAARYCPTQSVLKSARDRTYLCGAY